MRTVAAVLLAVALCSVPSLPVRAWGAQGHRIINGDAIRALPDAVPAFVRSSDAIAEIAALGPEPDRLKSAARAWVAEFDPGHFLDAGDDGTIAGVVPLAQLPGTREAYDTLLRTGTAPGGRPADQYTMGYLPYSIVEGWEEIVEDFAIWRVDVYGESHVSDPAVRAVFANDRKLREVLTLRDIGYWGHFVADGSQPLHVTVHYNGWGDYPNPNGYTQAHTIHSEFETRFVNAYATAPLVQSRIGAYVPSLVPMAGRVASYLATSLSLVPTVYRYDANGGLASGSAEAVGFMLDRLAAGAQMLRDAIADAYLASADAKVGFPAIRVRDVESGLVLPRPDAKP